MSKLVRLVFRFALVILGLTLMVKGHQEISLSSLATMLLGLGMIITSLYLYNRQFN
ncbi:DUF6903 family protein [Erysipelothrix urinaevulpis]|uniref:DUF6903 family protein n=1 Tax=Erysipelothrix urinaevulpis TaxID=2683717 RepID=UPI0013579E31|nr:hypothetical protein [Erysipelothrix urinaevulpis]